MLVILLEVVHDINRLCSCHFLQTSPTVSNFPLSHFTKYIIIALHIFIYKKLKVNMKSKDVNKLVNRTQLDWMHI